MNHTYAVHTRFESRGNRDDDLVRSDVTFRRLHFDAAYVHEHVARAKLMAHQHEILSGKNRLIDLDRIPALDLRSDLFDHGLIERKDVDLALGYRQRDLDRLFAFDQDHRSLVRGGGPVVSLKGR